MTGPRGSLLRPGCPRRRRRQVEIDPLEEIRPMYDRNKRLLYDGFLGINWPPAGIKKVRKGKK